MREPLLSAAPHADASGGAGSDSLLDFVAHEAEEHLHDHYLANVHVRETAATDDLRPPMCSFGVLAYYFSNDEHVDPAVQPFDCRASPLCSYPPPIALPMTRAGLKWRRRLRESFFVQHLLFPVVLLALMGAKIYSLTADVLVMTLTATDSDLSGEYILDEDLKVFSFPELVRDFWSSGAWFASLLVASGSAILPLSKGVLLVFCWYTPQLSYRRRGQLLGLLHHFGRYVFIDVFFSCFIVSVFFVEMNFGDLVIFVSTRVYSPYVIGVTCNVAVNIIGTWARSLRGV